MQRKREILILILLAKILMVTAQDVSFTQFYGNLIYLNPAFAGSAEKIRLSTGYRYQWGGFQSSVVSADMPVYPISSAVAAHFFFDDMGGFLVQNFSLVYAYRFKVNYYYKFVAAVKPVYSFFQAKPLQINGNTPESIGGKANSNFDFGLGTLFYGKDQYYGFSVDHLMKPFIPVSNATGIKYTVHYGCFIDIRNEKNQYLFTLSPNILIQKQNIYNQINLGNYLIFNNFTTGIWFRMHYPAKVSSFILSAGYHGPWYRVGYSYDFSASISNFLYFPSHEVSATFYFDSRFTYKKDNKQICPAF